jgi:hypothetical protein
LTLETLKKHKPFSKEEYLPKIGQHLDPELVSPEVDESDDEFKPEKSTQGRQIMGPSCILSSPNQVRSDSSSRSDDRKVNLFYLRDLLLKYEPKSSNLTMEKLKSIAKLKQNCRLQVFKFSIEPLLVKGQFSQQISELLIQKELIKTISQSNHRDLLKPLQKMLALNYGSLQADIILEIKAAIHSLKQRQDSAQQGPSNE